MTQEINVEYVDSFDEQFITKAFELIIQEIINKN